MDIDLELELEKILKEEITRELLFSGSTEISEEEQNKLINECLTISQNPFDAILIEKMRKLI